MAHTLANFPFWTLSFDENGKQDDTTAIAEFKQEVTQQGITDLFIFSHGWNNDHSMAMELYEGFFGEVRKLLDDSAQPIRRQAKVGTAGVIWPAIKWPDAEPIDTDGGAASMGGDTENSTLVSSLMNVYKTDAQQQLVMELTALLQERPDELAALDQFKNKIAQLMTETIPKSTESGEAPPSSIEELNTSDLFQALAEGEEPDFSADGGAAGLSDTFGKLWQGAKAALRVTTYWTMKERAGIVGQQGLGPLINDVHAANPSLKIYLIGHSFGARLVSYALKGLPKTAIGNQSPVKLLYLLQGAFSHFAFADQLPFDTRRKGDLAGMASRVDGPLLTTFSVKDLAVGQAYRIASLLARQDASDVGDLTFRWQGMGFDGAQAVDAAGATLGQPGTPYPFEKSKWINLDGNSVIVKGGLPSGAHSDIIYPHTAWVAISAAGIK